MILSLRNLRNQERRPRCALLNCLLFHLGLLVYMASCTPANTHCADSDIVCAPEAMLLYAVCESRLFNGAILPCSPLSLTGTVTSFAGSGVTGHLDGVGFASQFNGAQGLASDGVNLYVVEDNNRRVRAINITTRAVTTVAGDGVAGFLDGIAGAARFNEPFGITTDGVSLFVADALNHRIRRIERATNAVTTFVGDGTQGFLDGAGATAQFNFPRGLTTDGVDLYVSDQNNHRIRRVNLASRFVTTLAGDGTPGFLNGTGTAARFRDPYGIVTDGANLYVVDASNHRIRKIVIHTGFVTTLAGSGTQGFLDGASAIAQFDLPEGHMTTDGTYLFLADVMNQRIRQIEIMSGFVTTLAGNANGGGLVDGVGTTAEFSDPTGIVTDGISLFVVGSNNVVRKID